MTAIETLAKMLGRALDILKTIEPDEEIRAFLADCRTTAEQMEIHDEFKGQGNHPDASQHRSFAASHTPQ